MKNSERYNIIRRELNYNKFIKWLKKNPDIKFRTNNARNCPVALYLKDMLEETFDKNSIAITQYYCFYAYDNIVYSKLMPKLFTSFVFAIDETNYSLLCETIELAEEIKGTSK